MTTDDYDGADDAFRDLVAFHNSEAQQQIERFISRADGSGVTMYSYLQQEWTDDEAVAWARHHIDADTARTWQSLGLRPGEAGRFIRRGLSPLAVARTWWQAGIPFDEAASWIGAGMSPEEAVEQRALGVTAEQAETLRALRDEQAGD